MDDELLAYYDEIRRLAEAKSDSREEAEDLLSETFLAAFAYRHNGGVIEHPKTYLVHTLMHKRNSLLRRKYRLPKVVSLQTLPEDAADDFTAAEEAYERTEEAGRAAPDAAVPIRNDEGGTPSLLFQRQLRRGHRRTARHPRRHRQEPAVRRTRGRQERIDQPYERNEKPYPGQAASLCGRRNGAAGRTDVSGRGRPHRAESSHRRV